MINLGHLPGITEGVGISGHEAAGFFASRSELYWLFGRIGGQGSVPPPNWRHCGARDPTRLRSIIPTARLTLNGTQRATPFG